MNNNIIYNRNMLTDSDRDRLKQIYTNIIEQTKYSKFCWLEQT